MSRAHYHKWTEQELGKLAHYYRIGGVGAVRKVMPHLTDAQISGRAKKLGIRAVDELTLCIHDLMANLNRTVGVPEDFEPKRKVHHWVTVLSTLGASDQISEDQARQIELDMQTSYQTYFAFLGHGQKKQGMQ